MAVIHHTYTKSAIKLQITRLGLFNLIYLLPIALLGRERLEIHQGLDKQTARGNLITKLQEDWASDQANRRWTFKLIGQLDSWFSRSFGKVTYHITQVLSGHGCFGFYLHRFLLQDTDNCAQCGLSLMISMFSNAMSGNTGDTRHVEKSESLNWGLTT